MAIRPLRVEELAEILALDFDGAEGGIPELNKDWRWQNQQEAVLFTCSSLITIVRDGSHRVVQFSHFSVKEYLTSDRPTTSQSNISHFRISLEPAHITIVKASLSILLQSDNNAGEDGVKTSSPLAGYAGQHWVDHAKFENVSTSIKDGMQRLFDPMEPYFAAWLELHDIDNRWNLFADGAKVSRRAPLYHASLCGFRDVVARLITERSQLVNARVGLNHSPLVAALHNKHFEVAELLHQHGAAVDVTGYEDRTPLHAASADGFVDVAQWLLDHGAELEKQDANRRTPFHCAADSGHLEIVRMLLQHSINNISAAIALEEEFKIARLLTPQGSEGGNAQDRKRTSMALHLVLSNVSVKTV